jgi:hypothetical protein
MPARSTPRPHHAATLLLASALALAVLLAACGAPRAPGDDDPPDTTLVTRVVVEPAGFLLAAPGTSQALTATAFAEDGTVLDVAIVWETTGSGVAVDATGIATATAAVGSATIVARAEGVASAPALAVVASAVAGAVWVDDADVAGLEAVDDAETYGLGWRYAAVLRSARPVVGDLVVGTGLLPLGGRVVGVADVAAGRRVVLEVVDLDDLFDDLRIDVDVALDPADLVLEPEVLEAFEVERRADGTIRLLARPETAASLVRTLADDEFSLGPFQCKTKDVELPIFSLARPPEIELKPTIALQLAYDRALGGLQKMGIGGSLQLTIKYEPSIGAAFEGTLACTRKVATWTLPIGGPLAFVIGAQVPVGVGFDLKGKLVVAQAALDAQFVGRASAEAGIDCTGSEGCVPYGTATMSTDTFAFRPVFPDVDAQFRADLSLFGFGYADLALGSALLDRFPFLEDTLKLELVRVRAGIEQSLSLATIAAQADDPAYASGATTLLKSDIKIGSELPILERFEKLLKVSIEPLTITLPSVELWRSPSGSFVIAPSLARPGSATEPGQLATFTVTIQESSLLGITAVSVDTVELRWRRPVDGGGTTLAPGRGACFRLPRTSPSQTTFTCETDFTDVHLGEQAFYAFANVRLFGVPLPVPIELGLDTRTVVTVGEPPTCDGVPGALYCVTEIVGQVGHQRVVAISINADGVVVGTGSPPGDADPWVPFVWRDGARQDLALPATMNRSRAVRVNDGGQVLVLYFNPSPPFRARSLLWKDGLTTPIGSPAVDEEVVAWDLNAAGDVVGQFSYPLNDGTFFRSARAFRWDGTNLAFFDPLPDPETYGSVAVSINDFGDIVGEVRRSDLYLPFLWRAGQLTDLGALVPVHVANSGLVLGYTGQNQPGFHDQGQNYALPKGPWNSAVPLDVNASRVAVGYAYGFATSAAVVWRDDDIFDANDLIGDALPHRLTEATSINDRGQIVALAELDDGSIRSYLLTPATPPAP